MTNHQRPAQNQSKVQNQAKRPNQLKPTGSKKRSKLPKEVKTLTNSEQLPQDSTDEEEESQRQKAAIKAAVTGENPPNLNPNPKKEKQKVNYQPIDQKGKEKHPTTLGFL